MINTNLEKLAKVVVDYSLKVEKGHLVGINGPSFAVDMFQALTVEIAKKGAHIRVMPGVEGILELKLKYGTDAQLEFVDYVEKGIYTEFDGLIEIRGDYNPRKFSCVDPKKMTTVRAAPERKELMKIFEKRSSSGELKWIVIPYSCHAFAQEANMDLFTYTDFVNKSLFLDKQNPIESWQNMQKNQESIIEYLNNVDEIHLTGEDTDLTLSVKGRKWINCCGERNLPDGEVYTGPIENSVNGRIRFSYPGIYSGREVEDIYLEFKEGEVVEATAQKGQEILEEILKIENASRLGEFAIGTNYGITQFTKNILFDEKLGGTLHCALGLGFEKTGSRNQSPVHWDILKDMTLPGSKIVADGKLIYEEGKWKI
jgi:aminopeptidase